MLITVVILLFATSCKNDNKEVKEAVEETIGVLANEEKTEVNSARLDITSRVKAIVIDQLGIDEEEASIDASFTNDLGTDELDIYQLILNFEKEFEIRFPDN